MCLEFTLTRTLQPLADLLKGVDTAQRVLHDQAMMEYLIVSAWIHLRTHLYAQLFVGVIPQSADTGPFFEARWKLKHGLYMADGISQHRMLTVNRGDSNLR